MNIALVGAVAKCGVLGITMEEIESILSDRLKPQFLEVNKKALHLGAEYIINRSVYGEEDK